MIREYAPRMFDRATRRSSLARPFARRTWISLLAVAAGACSVYSNDLVDDAAGGVGNGGGAGAAGSTTGGKPNGTAGGGNGADTTDGGTPDPGDGGDGPTPEGGAGAATAGSAGTSGGGTSGTAGSAGTSATAGTAGTAGGPVGGPELFDDFEDNNLVIEPGSANDRSGVWYFFDDGKAGTITPDPLVMPATHTDEPPVELGTLGLHMTATGFATQGTGLGADFVDGKGVYDISKFTGLRFWAKVGTGKNTKHRVQISDVTTEAAGLKCKTAAGTANDELCGNHWGVGLTLTTAWKSYEVSFATLKQQPGWGKTAAAIDLTQVYGLQITAAASANVDLWVDQFELF